MSSCIRFLRHGWSSTGLIVLAFGGAPVLAGCGSEKSGPVRDEARSDAKSPSNGDDGDDGVPGRDGGSVDPGDDDDDVTGASITEPAPVTVDEDVESVFHVESKGVRIFTAENLPPGATFDGKTGTVTFRPDFTQSGDYDVTVTGFAGGPPATFEKSVHVKFTVKDSIAPPEPVIVEDVTVPGVCRRIRLRQTTDAFLDSPGHAGRTRDAIVSIPLSATTSKKAPVTIFFHGWGGGPNTNLCDPARVAIEPHDPDNTYWWGFSDDKPKNTDPKAPAHVYPYTDRRVQNVLAWVLKKFPVADPDRVFSTGPSMGGAGALTFGLFHARHVAGIESTIGQAIARNHRPGRINTMKFLIGTPADNIDGVWDALDMTRILRESVDARNEFIFTKHGKDDGTIHFGAMVMKSPLTKSSFYETLEGENIGHLSIWDEGAHGPADPVLKDGWWDNGWSRIQDSVSFLSRRLPFPAFARSSANGNPGDGSGNGKVAWNAESGYAADVNKAGDTGWSGDIAGALNRFLRWDSTGTSVTRTKLVLPLFLVASSGSAAPKAGYPTKGDRYDGAKPVVVDVTPRRTQIFAPLPGETVRWRFGSESGSVAANADGSVTVPKLGVSETKTELVLERDPL